MERKPYWVSEPEPDRDWRWLRITVGAMGIAALAIFGRAILEGIKKWEL